MGLPVVAFVCMHNACRSQMAQALAECMMPGEAAFLSAGTDPAPRVDAGALEELSRRGVPEEAIAALRPKRLSELPARGLAGNHGLRGRLPRASVCAP